MEIFVDGKTKTLYKNSDDTFTMFFKDDLTGKDGNFDPGSNEVGLTVAGAGNAGLELTKYFFDVFKSNDILTHEISTDIKNNTMLIKKVNIFGKGLEIICRFKAVGSFIRRYGEYINDEADLDTLIEFTIKNDEAGDPLITEDSLIELNILNEGEYLELKSLMKKTSTLIKENLAKKGLELYDIKLEFGKDKDGNIVVIDEISGGNMRVFKNGNHVMPLELRDIILK